MIAPEFRPPPQSPALPEPRIFVASDGYPHTWRLWMPDGPPRGLVVALHGIQSHSGWYGYSSRLLAEAGYAVAYLDRRGSGGNLQARGDAPHADRLVNDVIQLTNHLDRQGMSRLPRWLLGTSWGGKLALLIAARRPNLFDGVILQSPGICLRMGARRWQQWLLAAAHRAGAGDRLIDIPLNDAALFSDNPLFQHYVRTDPHSLRRVTLRFLNASFEIDRAVRSPDNDWTTPILILLAGGDRIVDNQATRSFFATRRLKRCKTILYPGACHTLEFARDRDAILGDLANWLKDTAPRRLRGGTFQKVR